MNADLRTGRYPLHVTIGTLFITLVIGLGVVLTWQNYAKTSKIILSSADRVQEQITRELIAEFNATYLPVAGALRLLALSPVATAASLDERLDSIGRFAVALENDPSVSGIQVGYGNGDYFIVRPLDREHARSTFEPPDGAVLVADHVEAGANGGRELVRLFFDPELRLIEQRPPVATDYDPRKRPWYTMATGRPAATAPYLFYFLRQVGLTVTVTAPVPGVVIASDVTLNQLSETVSRFPITESSEVALVSADGRVLAYRDPARLVRESESGEFDMARLTQLDSAVLTHVGQSIEPVEQTLGFSLEGRRWKGSMRRVARPGGVDLFALMVTPVDELLGDAVRLRWQSVMVTALIILFAIPVVWLVARGISNPLRQLAGEAGLISRFEFDTPIQTRSFIKEVDQLAAAMGLMKTTISRFLTLIDSLAGERDFDSLLKRIALETMSVSGARGVLTYLVEDDEEHLAPGNLQIRGQGELDARALPRFGMDDGSELAAVAREKRSRVFQLEPGSADGFTMLLEWFGGTGLKAIALPLRNRKDESIGVLCLLYGSAGSGEAGEPTDSRIAFVQALSGFAAVSLESRHLMMMQEALLDAFIKLIAGAIDSKSPYTGGHCQRVPELTAMLARAACESQAPPFREFELDREQWEALEIASWLHDCGKVTTPEYVVDKATKLETLYDRIHEVRTRFEVLKRDAEIRYWERVAEGRDSAAAREELDREWRQLDEDFAFVARCNQGGEFMAPDSIERLTRIAGRTWMRTLDDRLGISWEELERKQRVPATGLPIEEPLLADKPEHLIERSAAERVHADNPWGFRLDVPEHKYNRGELYNLRVERGTLSAEERFKINEHIVQTIIMLERLPYPKHLRDVPVIAGGHHETMKGTGYPRRLSGSEMPLTARMMAIADIFEALTASDRPYKKAKKLSEAVRIMNFMKQDGHIDPDLFELFLVSKIHLEYGRKFLKPEQVDPVDISAYVGAPGPVC